jgi:hypothetical protein
VPSSSPVASLKAAKEKWAAVSGYTGLYEVSDRGRVRSLERTVGSEKEGTLRVMPGVLLEPLPMPKGYQQVHLFKDGKSATVTVHSLVAEAFIGPRPKGKQVAHNDGDPTNNRASNLRYVGQAENEADKKKHGTVKGTAMTDYATILKNNPYRCELGRFSSEKDARVVPGDNHFTRHLDALRREHRTDAATLFSAVLNGGEPAATAEPKA